MATTDLATDVASTLAIQLNAQVKNAKVSSADTLAFLLEVGDSALSAASKKVSQKGAVFGERKPEAATPIKTQKSVRDHERPTVASPALKKQKTDQSEPMRSEVSVRDLEIDEVDAATVTPIAMPFVEPLSVAQEMVSTDALRAGFVDFTVVGSDAMDAPDEMLMGDAEGDLLALDPKMPRSEKGGESGSRQALSDMTNAPVTVAVAKQELMSQQRMQAMPIDALAETVVKAETTVVQNGAIEMPPEKLVIDATDSSVKSQVMHGDAVRPVLGGADTAFTQSGGDQNLGQALQHGAQHQLTPAATAVQQAQNAAEFKGELQQTASQPQAVGGATSAATQQLLTRPAATPPVAQLARAVVPPQINQIAIQIKKGIDTGNDSITVRLKPAELGTVDVRLDLNGRQVVAQVSADNDTTLQLLKENGDHLKQALESLGLDLADDGMNFNLKGQDEHAQQHQSGKHTIAPQDLESMSVAEEQNNDPHDGRYTPPYRGGNASVTA